MDHYKKRERRRAGYIIWFIALGLILAIGGVVVISGFGLIDYFDAIPYKVVTLFITLILLSNLAAKLALIFIYLFHDERISR